MEVINHHRSNLNPNAPLFVPLAYRTVEDFSDKWWSLVQTSPWFRDYWIQERYQDPQSDSFISDVYDSSLPDDLDSWFFDDLIDDSSSFDSHEEEKEHGKELVSMKNMKWNKGRAQAPKYGDKVPKTVNLKMSPRVIQQPR